MTPLLSARDAAAKHGVTTATRPRQDERDSVEAECVCVHVIKTNVFKRLQRRKKGNRKRPELLLWGSEPSTLMQ